MYHPGEGILRLPPQHLGEPELHAHPQDSLKGLEDEIGGALLRQVTFHGTHQHMEHLANDNLVTAQVTLLELAGEHPLDHLLHLPSCHDDPVDYELLACRKRRARHGASGVGRHDHIDEGRQDLGYLAHPPRRDSGADLYEPLQQLVLALHPHGRVELAALPHDRHHCQRFLPDKKPLESSENGVASVLLLSVDLLCDASLGICSLAGFVLHASM
mmetsp:Transcript_16268/g.54515  ORF Transcript_16268/g.54515 Transcript_16268/m.54515 type:complete len:215 (-) Transcript_16268:74-718(-)